MKRDSVLDRKQALELSGLRILVVDDEVDIRQGLQLLLTSLGAIVSSAADGREALEVMGAKGADFVLTDLMMPHMSGSDLLLAIKERWPETLVIVLTGFGTIQNAVSCIQAGASHFMTKPFDNAEVRRLVSRLGRSLLASRDAPVPKIGSIVAEDPAMNEVLALVQRAAKTKVPVLIEGASGTGKELIARALHDLSHAKDKPFMAVNTAALTESLLESELFGFARGAFTGADHARDGLFAQAKGGTVFLDEISSMPHAFQSKLLRVLQEHTVRPVGASEERPVEFRLVAASNRNLEAMIASGEFREDLLYRMAVLRIWIPPLAERRGDIEPLARHFLQVCAQDCLEPGAPIPEFGADALAALQTNPWPGNVRELQNAVQRAVIVCGGPRIAAHHLGLDTRPIRPEPPADELNYLKEKQVAIERFQREFVHRSLETSGGNISQAATQCGLTRAALQRIMRQLNIDRADFA